MLLDVASRLVAAFSIFRCRLPLDHMCVNVRVSVYVCSYVCISTSICAYAHACMHVYSFQCNALSMYLFVANACMTDYWVSPQWCVQRSARNIACAKEIRCNSRLGHERVSVYICLHACTSTIHVYVWQGVLTLRVLNCLCCPRARERKEC